MTQAEFVAEVRRGLLLILRALMKYYGLGWADILPREAVESLAVDALAKTA